jgi:protein SCO1/2
VSSSAKRGLIVFVVGLVILAGGIAFQYLQLGTGGSGIQLGTGIAVSLGGPFALTDQNGEARRSEEFRGKLMLIYFGYTYCPDVCPTELQTMSQAIDLLGDRATDVQPIFITIDPERDNVATMKSYAENFTPRLLALTGTPQEIAAVAKAYRVFYQRAKSEGDDYVMDHSSIVYLMGKDGAYLAHFSGETSAEQMAAAIAKQH